MSRHKLGLVLSGHFYINMGDALTSMEDWFFAGTLEKDSSRISLAIGKGEQFASKVFSGEG